MKIVLVILLLVVAVVLFGIGLIASADPEGRGASITLGCWAGAVACVVGIVAAFI